MDGSPTTDDPGRSGRRSGPSRVASARHPSRCLGAGSRSLSRLGRRARRRRPVLAWSTGGEHDQRPHDYARSLFGAFCDDADDVETRSMLAFSLVVGDHFLAADHGSRSRADVIDMAMTRLLA